MAKGKKEYTPRESRDWALADAMGTQTIEDARDAKLRQIYHTLLDEGVDISPLLEERGIIRPKLTRDEKLDYVRIKNMERLEAARTDRKDEFRVDSDGEPLYDGGDPDETGDPEQDSWLRNWWIRIRLTKI